MSYCGSWGQGKGPNLVFAQWQAEVKINMILLTFFFDLIRHISVIDWWNRVSFPSSSAEFVGCHKDCMPCSTHYPHPAQSERSGCSCHVSTTDFSQEKLLVSMLSEWGQFSWQPHFIHRNVHCFQALSPSVQKWCKIWGSRRARKKPHWHASGKRCDDSSPFMLSAIVSQITRQARVLQYETYIESTLLRLLKKYS